MAAGTYTASTFSNLPVKAVHVGNQTIQGQFVSTAPTTPNSLGDIIFLAKIPHGARVVDFAVDHSTSETTFGMKYGLASGCPTAGGGASLSFYSASLATATVKTRYAGGTVQRTANLAGAADPWRVSVSDLDPNRYGIFAAKIATASASTTFVVNFSITYRMDETGS